MCTMCCAVFTYVSQAAYIAYVTDNFDASSQQIHHIQNRLQVHVVVHVCICMLILPAQVAK